MPDDFKPTLKSAIRYLRELVEEDGQRADITYDSRYGFQGRALLKLAADRLQEREDADSMAGFLERKQ